MRYLARFVAILGMLAIWTMLSAQEAAHSPAQLAFNTLANTLSPPADRAGLAQQFYPVIEHNFVFSDDWQVGDITTFYITDSDSVRVLPVLAELLAVGETVYVWVQTGMPVRKDSAQHFAAKFDTEIYVPVTDLWQIDLLTERVHTLFTTDMPESIAGYFLNRDTLQALVAQPDLLAFNLLASTLELDNPYVLSIAAHELQHLLRYQTQPTTEAWLDEGFSTFTEEILAIDPTDVFIEAFLEAPETPLTLRAENANRLSHYGAETLFISYFHQRYGIEGLQALSAVSGGNYDALDALLRQNFDTDFVTFFADWVLANRLQAADKGYGYAGVILDADLPRAESTWITALPFTQARRLPQFAADYFEMLHPKDNISITLEFLPEVALLPEQSYPGNAFWYSRLADNVHAALTCTFDLTNVNRAALNYDIWYDLEDFWDYGYVFLSDDNGQTWMPLQTQYGTQENPFARAYGWGYTGASQNWQNETISLDVYAGKEIVLQFAVITDDATLQPGMALDNLAIPEIGFINNGETPAENCLSEGFARVTNQLPQQVIVQVVQHRGDALHVSRWQIAESTTFSLERLPDTQMITLVITPVTPYTAMPLHYTLQIE